LRNGIWNDLLNGVIVRNAVNYIMQNAPEINSTGEHAPSAVVIILDH